MRLLENGQSVNQVNPVFHQGEYCIFLGFFMKVKRRNKKPQVLLERTWD
jgi:hypothetical protein